MKRFLKKINRGVILSLVVLVALAGYYMTVSALQKPMIDEMSQVLEQYIGIQQQTALLPEQYRKVPLELPETLLEERQNQRIELLTPLFAPGSDEVVKTHAELMEDNFASSDYFQLVEEASYQWKGIASSSIQEDEATVLATYTMRQTVNSDGYTHQWSTTNQLQATFSQVNGKWLLTRVVDPYYPD